METGNIEKVDTSIGSDEFIVHLFNVERFDKFLGRILTLAETLGLSASQETAFKSLLKQEVWNVWENPWGVESKRSIIHNN